MIGDVVGDRGSLIGPRGPRFGRPSVRYQGLIALDGTA